MKIRLLLVAVFLLVAAFAVPATASAAQTRVTPSYLSFLSRQLKAASFMTTVLGYVADDFNDLDPYTAAYNLNRLKSRANAELKWLNNVRPRSCYLKLYNASKSQYSAVINMATYLRRWSLAYPFGTTSDYNNGTRWMRLVSSRLTATTRVLKATHC